jgi:L-2,4-diaminobutyrate decarboxylase
LGAKPESNIVCFRFINPKGDPDKRVSAIRKKIVREGEYYIVQTVIDGNLHFRITIMNPFTDMKILKELTQKIRSIVNYL